MRPVCAAKTTLPGGTGRKNVRGAGPRSQFAVCARPSGTDKQSRERHPRPHARSRDHDSAASGLRPAAGPHGDLAMQYIGGSAGARRPADAAAPGGVAEVRLAAAGGGGGGFLPANWPAAEPPHCIPIHCLQEQLSDGSGEGAGSQRASGAARPRAAAAPAAAPTARC